MEMQRITTFAERLKAVREEKSLSLKDFEKLVQTPAQTLSRYELGQRIPKITDANKIAELLNVDSSWLQGYDVPRERTRPSDALSPTEKKLMQIASKLNTENFADLLMTAADLYANQTLDKGENK